MDDIYITLTNITLMTLYIGASRNDLVVKSYESITISIEEYIKYIRLSSSAKKIIETCFQIKFDKEYEDIVLHINNFSKEHIEYYTLLNQDLTKTQKNAILLIKEMI